MTFKDGTMTWFDGPRRRYKNKGAGKFVPPRFTAPPDPQSVRWVEAWTIFRGGRDAVTENTEATGD